MANLYVIDFGGDDERARREALRDEERRRLRGRYARHLVTTAAVDEITARRVIAALFDPLDTDGRRCECACHPRLSAAHGDGLDCVCTWDDSRHEAEASRWEQFWNSDAATALRESQRREEQEITAWLAGQPGVTAARTTTAAPEQWEGTVDGHSFYFRERHGAWRIELDMRESGRYARRLTRIADDGELVTEPVPLKEGDVIAEGSDSQLGTSAIGHIDFITRTIRDHLRRAGCDHAGALRFCPGCGERMAPR